MTMLERKPVPAAVSNEQAATPVLDAFKTLLRKDWRFYRVHVVATGVLGAACYLVGMGAAWNLETEFGRMDVLQASAAAALALLPLLAAAYGGAAIAAERYDRTADFVAMLPVSRRQIFASKGVAMLLALLPAALFHLFILMFLMGSLERA